MTILGIGIDIIKIIRIKKIFIHSGNRLAKRILNTTEWKNYTKNKQPIRFLTKHFAIKEAVSKALGTGIRNGLTFNQFEVFHDKLGKPNIYLHHKAAEIAKNMGVTKIHVSLTDENCYVFATVIIEN
ncbi:Holo-[acyl-carrier-protein] synthase [Serratia symbiotica]|nr:Holo-[acyl-carrier-protein] synthase [Serratia symbiotica]